jgi:hypothetical protein
MAFSSGQTVTIEWMDGTSEAFELVKFSETAIKVKDNAGNQVLIPLYNVKYIIG